MYISILYTTKHFFIFSFSDHLQFEDRTVLTKIDPETHRQLMGSLFSGTHGIPMVKKKLVAFQTLGISQHIP